MLTTGDFKLCYPVFWPGITDTSSVLGGTGVTTSYVSVSSTGLFNTGTSGVPGASAYIRYAKIFIVHQGITGSSNNLRDPMIYITNETVSDQLTICPDGYWLNIHASQTGKSNGRASLPHDISSGYFSGYTVDSPLQLSNFARGQVNMVSGDTVGIWLKLSIPAGLPSSANNSFNIGVRGEAY